MLMGLVQNLNEKMRIWAISRASNQGRLGEVFDKKAKKVNYILLELGINQGLNSQLITAP